MQAEKAPLRNKIIMSQNVVPAQRPAKPKKPGALQKSGSLKSLFSLSRQPSKEMLEKCDVTAKVRSPRTIAMVTPPLLASRGDVVARGEAVTRVAAGTTDNTKVTALGRGNVGLFTKNDVDVLRKNTPVCVTRSRIASSNRPLLLRSKAVEGRDDGLNMVSLFHYENLICF